MSESQTFTQSVCFLVVLYGKLAEESETIHSLSTLLRPYDLHNIKVVIWNNGPNAVAVKDNDVLQALSRQGACVSFKENLANPPLSKIYNEHAFESELFAVLDDDTELNTEYLLSLESFSNSHAELFVPLIEFNDDVHYPKLFRENQVITDIEPGVKESFDIRSISSGLCVKSSLLKQLKSTYGSVFDEAFALYGIDTSFFRRCLNLPLNRYFLGAALNHKLSGLQAVEKIGTKRLEERFIDFALQLRGDFKFGNLVGLLYFLRAHCDRKELWLMMPKVVSYFARGRHPRSAIEVSAQKSEQIIHD